MSKLTTNTNPPKISLLNEKKIAQNIFNLDEISKHSSENDCWIIIEGKVYDVTKFLSSHPGGKKVILNLAGKDASKQFKMFHKEGLLQRYFHLQIGEIGIIDEIKKEKIEKKITKHAIILPYTTPSWNAGHLSPYYSSSHFRLRNTVREFVDREIIPYTSIWDQNKKVPKELWEKCAKAGFLQLASGLGWVKEYLGLENIPCGIKPEEFDHFHELIIVDEFSRCGAGGVLWALFGGLSIGLPPVLYFGSEYLKNKVVKDCLTGKKFICLAITEPEVGSDVANLTTTAKKTQDGKYYIVNGSKKWITNGIFADYFTVAVRTGVNGMNGISFLLLERGMPGITTTEMKCSGVWGSGTTFITFEDVKVPVQNLIGKENEGFKYIMYNFNHERWGISVQANRFARVCLEEAMQYALKRKTFGKLLIEHPVIRLKLAHMARQVEATHNWLENITYQMSKMNKEEQNKCLGGPIALLKAQCSTTFEFCAREATQIFGGLAYTMGGQGEKVERLSRECKAYTIPAGSEEIMLDLGIRNGLKDAFKSKL